MQAFPSPRATSSSSNPHPRQAERIINESGNFCFSDGNLWLRTDDTLYHVHRYLFLRHSTMFNELVIASACLYSDGTDKNNPIVLREVSTRGFDAFLSVLYPSSYQSHSPRSVEQWRSILSLAIRWNFPSIRDLAVKHLERLQPDNTTAKFELTAQFGSSPTSLTSTDPAKAQIEASGGGGGILAVIHDFRTKSSISLRPDGSNSTASEKDVGAMKTAPKGGQ